MEVPQYLRKRPACSALSAPGDQVRLRADGCNDADKPPLKAKPSGRNGFADAALTGQPNVPPASISEISTNRFASRQPRGGYLCMQIIQRSSRRPIHSTPKVITVTEAARLLRIGRSTAYEAANRYLAGDPDGLPVIRIGRCLRVPMKLLAELIEDADAFVEIGRAELQPIDDPAATYSEFFDDELLRLPGFE